MTGGDALGRHEGRFKLALAQAALARELRPHDERIAARAAAGAERRGARRAARGARGAPQRALARLGFASRARSPRRCGPGVDYDAWRARGGALPRARVIRTARRRARAGRGVRASTPSSPPRGCARRSTSRSKGMRLELARVPGLRVDAEPRPGSAALARRRAARSRRGLARVRARRRAARRTRRTSPRPARRSTSRSRRPRCRSTKRVLGDPALGLAFGEVTARALRRAGARRGARGRRRPRTSPPARAAAPRRAARRPRGSWSSALAELRARRGSAPAPRRPSSATRAGSPPMRARAARRSTGCARPASGTSSRARCARASGASTWKTRGAGELLKELWNTGAHLHARRAGARAVAARARRRGAARGRARALSRARSCTLCADVVEGTDGHRSPCHAAGSCSKASGRRARAAAR